MDAEALLNRFLPEEHTETVPVESLFAAILNESVSQAKLANRFEPSRQAINQSFDDFEAVGLIKQTPGGYWLTGAGAMALYQYTEAANTASEEALRFCVGSENRVKLLNALQEHPARQSELTTQPDLPSRSTVGRTITAGEKHGLVTQTGTGGYKLTEEGERIVTAYEQIIQAFEQIIAKTACLQTFDVECADFPVAALEDERLVERKPGREFIELEKLIEYIESIDETETDRIRLFGSFFDMRISNAMTPLRRSDTRIDMISPGSALKEIPTEGRPSDRVREGLETENSHWYLYPGTLPVGLFIVDDSEVALGAKSPKAAIENSGTVFCSDPEIVEWAIDLHAEYREESSKPLEYTIEWLKDESRDLLDSFSPDLFQ